MKEIIDKLKLIEAIQEGELIFPNKDLSNELNIEIIRHDLKQIEVIINDIIRRL